MDLSLVVALYGQSVEPGTKEDVNQDGKVDIHDLMLVSVHFGESCNPELKRGVAPIDNRTAIYVVPSSSILTPGDTVKVQVIIEDVEEMTGFELDLVYDSDLLRLITAAEGGMLSENGRVPLFPASGQSRDGLLKSIAFVRADQNGTNGSGVLLEAIFQANATGDATVAIEGAMTINSIPEALPVAAEGATLRIK